MSATIFQTCHVLADVTLVLRWLRSIGFDVTLISFPSHYPALCMTVGRDVAVSSVFPEQMIHAQDIAILGIQGFVAGEGVEPEYGLPVYLRDQVAQKKAV